MANLMLIFYLLSGWALIVSAILVIGLIMFGKLIWLQFRIWILGRRGFHQIEHVGEDKIRRYFFARPKETKFDFADGFFLYLPETTTKTTELLRKVNISILDEKKDNSFMNEELKKLVELIQKLKYDRRAVTLRWGIPTITYYGDNPEPIYFEDRKKVYGAGVIKDMYLRLMLTQKYGWIKMIMVWGVIILTILGLVQIGNFFVYKGNQQNMAKCQITLGTCQQNLIEFTNRTLATIPKPQPTNITI